MRDIIAVGAAGGGRLTETGLSLGTPYYMSPEQATGDQHIGPPSDTYALAAVLYEMLTGDPPYVGSTAQAVLGKIIQGAPVSATQIRKSVPANVDAAIRKALEKLPADRFTGAQDFAKALAEASTGLDPLDLLKRRVPQFVVAAAVVGMGILGGVDQFTQQGMLPEVSYPLALILVVHGVAATAVISWFHGTRGKQRVAPLEVGVLGVLGVSWIALSVWTLLR